ncbi:bestrophin-4 isoform X2 [Chironomus tepperi]|uniref:bestrophin-4 isoform X2 n=1 Tax=Chironomus tepperi TaxID=113505 RepID=UPI00391F351C
MTVSYTGQVATCRGFGCFLKLLMRWRGSIYKLVWLDLTSFLLVYYTLNLTYRFVLNEEQKKTFEAMVKYCDEHSNLIPLSFVLGFYVSIVMTRWWNQYTSIPWPDPIAVFVSATVHGQDERGRVMRRTIMRYVCLCISMVLGNLSPKVKKRFPTLNHYVEAGLLNDNERDIIEDLNMKFPKHSKHWLPIVWAASIITRARKEGRIRDDFAVKTIIDELNKFRGQCGVLIAYDTISIPLVYTQVVTIAVYSYFLVALFGQQWTEGKGEENGYKNRIDLYFPIFSLLQFFFYMGWLKVAEQLINPFGEDDDDFEVNWMIDRNLQVSYLIVDEMHHDHPELLKDQYWDSVLTTDLPYTIASMGNREEPPAPSTANIEIKKGGGDIVTAPSMAKMEDMVGKNATTMNYEFPDNDIDSDKDNDDNASGIHFTASGRRRNASGSASNTSMHSVAGTMSRVNTVTSLLKRFLSKDDGSRPGSAANPEKGLGNSASSASITERRHPAGSMRKITDQVIEEVDEQMTITSMRNNNVDPRPTAQSIFSKPSEPIDVPGSIPPPYGRFFSATVHENDPSLFPIGGVDDLLSSSAPTKFATTSSSHQPNTLSEFDPKNFETQLSRKSESMEEHDSTAADDDFEKLRQEREAARLAKQKEKIARSISTQQGIVNQMELHELLTDALNNVQKSESGASSPTHEAA